MSFVGLHIHSDYSLLDGASQLPALVDRVIELGMKAIALTDHGVMYGAIELIKVCRSKNVKPIIGNEMYVMNGNIESKDRRRVPKYHQVVLAKNTQGYKNLVKLTTISHLKGMQGSGIFARPCVNKELLAQYHEGLIVTSACLGGEVPQAILAGKPDIARRVAQQYKDIFGDDYYLEIQDHGSPEDRIVNVEIIKIARELGIKFVATNDSHFISCYDVEAHDALLCIQTKKLISEDKRMRYSGTEYLKSAEEMKQLFHDHLPDDVIAEAIATTVEVADKVEPYHIMGESRIPNYTVPPGHTADTYLEHVAWQGLFERFNRKSHNEIDPVYRDRLDYELKMMQQMGFSTYFLVVWDYIKYARDNNIPVGPGRGCVLGDTKVMLATGEEVEIKDIQIGQQVITHQGNILPVTKTHKYDCDEEIVKFDVANEELCLTKDHKIWAVKGEECIVNSEKLANICKPSCNRYCSEKPYQKYQLEWIEAGKLRKDDFVVFPRVKSTEQNIVFDLLDFIESKSHLRYDDNFIWYEVGTNHLQTKKIPRKIEFNEDFARILGYYIAEGWSRLGIRESAVGFGLCSDELDFANEIVTLLKRVFNLESKIIPHLTKKSLQVIGYSRIVGEFLSTLCGIGANKKHIPWQVVTTGKSELVKILIAYIFRGDGHPGTKDKTINIKCSTTSPTLASQLRLLLARFGYWSSIIKRKKCNDKWSIEYSVKLSGKQLLNWNSDFLDFPVGVKIQKFYRNDSFYIDDSYIYLKIKDVSRFNHTGYVYDISVPGDTSYVGNSIAIHNSAAGSLVAYALRITNIDPVHHGLLFERFLNPERKSMPDIDTDFCIDKRDKVIDYVTEKYGADKVAQIITFNRLTSKAVLKDVARVLDIPYGDADRMAKLIPVVRGKPTKLSVMISDATPEKEFKERYESDPNVRHWVDMAMRVEGTNKTYGVHAAGVVISSEPLDEIVPLQRNNDGSVITQYFMEDLESLGLLKMDFLGLRNLTLIQKTIDLIKQNRHIDIDPDALPLEERRVQKILAKGEVKKMPKEVQNTYKILEAGELEGIFQLESSGMKQIVRDLKPSCIEDISSILALYRPGPLDAGLIPKFINRKHGREKIEYQTPLQELILEETYGVLVYQEQIMKQAQDLAGYSLGQADLLRRAMGKKKASEMQKHRETFVDGAAKNGVRKQLAEFLFEEMVKFAEYCFNKSHSTAYGYVTYQTAYLKANFPVEYMAALLTSNSGDTDKVQKYIANCLAMNIPIEPVDINRSIIDFKPLESSILFGFCAVRNLGQGASNCILEARESGGEFKSLADLCDRVDLRAVNRRALETLIYCGAFDRIEPNRNQLIHDLDLTIDWAQSRLKERASGQVNLFDWGGLTNNEQNTNSFEVAPKAPPVADFSQQDKLHKEKELLGFYVSDHPLKSVRSAAQVLAPINLTDLETQSRKALLCAVVIVTSIKPIVTKKGDRMAILKLEDLTGQIEAVVFPRVYEQIDFLLLADARLIVWGKADRKDDDGLQLIVENAQAIEKVEMLMVELTIEQAVDLQKQQYLKSILQEQSGDKDKALTPVIAIVTAENQRQLVRFGRQYWVQNCHTAIAALKAANFFAYAQPLAQ